MLQCINSSLEIAARIRYSGTISYNRRMICWQLASVHFKCGSVTNMRFRCRHDFATRTATSMEPSSFSEALITQVWEEPPADQESTTAGLVRLQLVQTPRSSSATTSECANASFLRKKGKNIIEIHNHNHIRNQVMPNPQATTCAPMQTLEWKTKNNNRTCISDIHYDQRNNEP